MSERQFKLRPRHNSRKRCGQPTVAVMFRLYCRRTVFEALQVYRNAAGIECVYGRTLDDKFQTVARVVDVVWL